MAKRQEKFASLLRELVGSFINAELNMDGVNTITLVEVSDDLKRAKIFINVYPEDKEEKNLASIKDKTRNINNYIKSKLRTKFLPSLSFEIDKGIKIERRIDELLAG